MTEIILSEYAATMLSRIREVGENPAALAHLIREQADEFLRFLEEVNRLEDVDAKEIIAFLGPPSVAAGKQLISDDSARFLHQRTISVFGTGYIGMVLAACLAETGRDVLCIDIDPTKVVRLNSGEVPIYEPGLEPLIERNLREGRLLFTTDVARAAIGAEIIFVTVGIPLTQDGMGDLRYLLAVAETIGQNMPPAGPEKIIVVSSNAPVGSTAKVRGAISKHTSRTFHVCSNPLFLQAGTAVQDFMTPDRLVVGVDSEYAREKISEIFAPFARTTPILFVDPASAEIGSYAASAMIATRISLMNTIARLCEAYSADVTLVRHIIGSDLRIGPSFLSAGLGYGGHQLTSHMQALIETLSEVGVDAGILEAAVRVNVTQNRLLIERVVKRFDGDLSGRRLAVWGLAVYPDTDDMREAPSLSVVRGLISRGAKVYAHDPEAQYEAMVHFSDLLEDGTLELCEHSYDCLNSADALLVLTDWQSYRNPDFRRMHRLLTQPLIFDGRNLWNPEKLRQEGFEYHSLGRPPVFPTGQGATVLPMRGRRSSG